MSNNDTAEVFQMKMQTNRAIQILLAAVTATFLTVAYFQLRHISAQQSENLDLVQSVKGEYLVAGGYYAYNDLLTNERIIGDRNGHFLNISITGQDSASFNGFGFLTNIDIPANADFETLLYNYGPNIQVFFNITDGSPHGESFIYSLLLNGKTQNTIRVPLSKFTRNTWQEPDASEDGILDTKGIRQVAISIKPYSVMNIDVKSMGFSWGTPVHYILWFYILAALVGLTLIFRSGNFVFSGKHGSQVYAQRVLNRAAFIGIMGLATIVLFQKLLQSDTLFYALFGIFLSVIFIDEFVSVPKRVTPLWAFRYILVAVVFICLRTGSPTWSLMLGIAIVIGHSPYLTINKSRYMLLTIVPILAAWAFANRLIPLSANIPTLAITAISTLLAYFTVYSLKTTKEREDADKRHQLFEGIFEHTTDAILLTDTAGKIESVNNGFMRMLELSEKAIVGKPISAFLTGTAMENLSLQQGQYDVSLVDSNGKTHTALLRVHPLLNKQRVTGYILIAADITERKLMEERLQALSVEDGLTKLYNRRFFDECLGEEWLRAKRNKSPLSLLMIDVDFFKKYNDTYGHQAGDAVLVTIGALLNGLFRRTADKAARYGGEEFVIILPDTPEAGLHSLAERLHNSIRDKRIEHSSSLVAACVTVSIGGATVEPGADGNVETTGSFIKLADDALYRAKEEGRNRSVIAGR